MDLTERQKKIPVLGKKLEKLGWFSFRFIAWAKIGVIFLFPHQLKSEVKWIQCCPW